MKDINATVIVDLSGSEEEILKRLNKDARWEIKKAIKSGLIVEESKEFEKAYDILKNVLIQGGAGMPNFDNFKKNTLILFVCKFKDKIIGMASLKLRNKLPTLDYNASLKEYNNLCPNSLLYWHCIKWAKQQGYDKFDLGGWQINARGRLKNINKFKERWGKVVYWEEDYPFYVAMGRKLIRNFKFFWWLNKKLRGRR